MIGRPTINFSANGAVVVLILVQTFLIQISFDRSLAAQVESLPPDLEQRINSAVSLYQNALTIEEQNERVAEFRKAEIAFSSIVDSNLDETQSLTADFYSSWGNAAFQTKDLGVAVLAYRKALERNPLHQQAQKNLKYVRSQLPDWATADLSQDSAIEKLFFWNHLFAASTLKMIAAAAFAFGCLFICVGYWQQISWLRYLSIGPFLVWVLALVVFFLPSPKSSNQDIVFVAVETQAHSADSTNSPPSFNIMIPAGTEAKILEAREGWARVQFGEDKQGWVQSSSFQKVVNSKNR